MHSACPSTPPTSTLNVNAPRSHTHGERRRDVGPGSLVPSMVVATMELALLRCRRRSEPPAYTRCRGHHRGRREVLEVREHPPTLARRVLHSGNEALAEQLVRVNGLPSGVLLAQNGICEVREAPPHGAVHVHRVPGHAPLLMSRGHLHPKTEALLNGDGVATRVRVGPGLRPAQFLQGQGVGPLTHGAPLSGGDAVIFMEFLLYIGCWLLGRKTSDAWEGVW